MARNVKGAGGRQREELLDLAWKLAARDGLAACTYRALAAEAGTSPTPFVRCFPTRQELLLGLFEKLASGEEESRGEMARTGDPLDALIAEGLMVLEEDAVSADRRRVSVDMAFEGARDPALGRRVRARDRERAGRWLELLDEGGSRGLVREDRLAGEILDQLVSLLDGLVFANVIYPKRLSSEHVSRLWEGGVRRLVDPAVSPGVHQRLVIPDGPTSRTLLLGDREITRRQELLGVAFRVTARDGLAGLSFRSLAREAGTSTAPFTYAFGTREKLLADMVRSIWAGIFEVRELASMIPSPVDRFFAEWAAEFSDDREQVDRERTYYELHHGALTDPSLARLLLEGDEHGFAVTMALIEAARGQGLVRDDVSAEDIVDTLYALVDGIGLRRGLLAEKRPSGYRVAIWEDGGRRMLAP